MLPNEFLFALIHLSAFVSSHIYVEQQPAAVYLSEGENVTLSCHIRADEDVKISKFTVEWYMEDEDRQLHEVKNLSQLRGRLQENTNINQHSTSLSLFMLKLNDSSKYVCDFFILIDQKILQHYTNGTILVVQEELTTAISILSTTVNTNNNTGNNTDADTEYETDNILHTFLIFLPLSLKFVSALFICFYTLLSYTSVIVYCPG
ncbi:uncharacterized protein LOC113643503 [Tachysurus fulvidraco]|uniref:uncharacterized protein LOC113643503 n=1 Tax=Tachysurus fulvidraco TaxID=1234273 RepID=UPI000F4F2C04|nr:uncharacterized protein LOC113643503 [Tachysurus fulvidraco]